MIFGILFGFVLLLGGVVGYYASSLNSFFNTISVENKQEVQKELDLHLDEVKPFSVLLLGEDLAQDDTSRTDTIIVATVNPTEKSVKMVSIPRDTLVHTEDGITEKINAMYTIGGIEKIKEEVEKLLDIPISFYSILDFKGLIKLVDAVGGVNIHSNMEFTVQNSQEKADAIKIKKGPQKLNGEEALGYARMRQQDPEGVFGRQARQEEVIKALIKELVSPKMFTHFDEILDAIAPHLKTNVKGDQMLKIAANYMSAANSIESLSLTGEGEMTYFPHYGLNVYVFLPHEEVLRDISKQLKEHLELGADYVHPLNEGRESWEVDHENIEMPDDANLPSIPYGPEYEEESGYYEVPEQSSGYYDPPVQNNTQNYYQPSGGQSEAQSEGLLTPEASGQDQAGDPPIE